LSFYKDRKIKIGSFSAASNVTGVLTAVDAVSVILHKAGALAIYDYATAAPYVKMDMNPVILGEDSSYVYKDAIIFSGHKFVGGPGCPGVLVVKKRLLPPSCDVPTMPGGGTVFYVTDDHHRYLSNREEREEGGTPNIIGDVKIGLVMHLKQSIGVDWIEREELKISHYVMDTLTRGSNNKLIILGRSGWYGGINSQGEIDNSSKHLPIFSFLIRAGSKLLHPNFVCALLNDLFGVQARGGCQCAGPFSQMLLGIYLPIYPFNYLFIIYLNDRD
jgi:selenocysteine lyase/cysteine desulfurase